MKYRLELEGDHIEVLRTALGEMKCRDAIRTFNIVDAQVMQQNAAVRQATLNAQVNKTLEQQAPKKRGRALTQAG